MREVKFGDDPLAANELLNLQEMLDIYPAHDITNGVNYPEGRIASITDSRFSTYEKLALKHWFMGDGYGLMGDGYGLSWLLRLFGLTEILKNSMRWHIQNIY